MYIGDSKFSDEFPCLVLQTIRDIGIKHRHKKSHFNKNISDPRHVTKDTKIFKRPLGTLTTELVILKSGISVEIPSFVVEACSHIKLNCGIEGVFRKAGSAARVREIKAIVDGGKHLESKHHVIDVSNILKLFFRELPEPLLPFVFHDLLLRCLLVKDKATEGILLTCLLFPSVHLNTLVYLMEFFRDVADNEQSNKMSISNLAIIITPSLMPVEEKNVHSGTRLGHHVRVIEILMRNTERIGIIPERVAEKALTSGYVLPVNEDIANGENDESKVKKKKKRRSGSLTRMINGLKKIVGKGSPEVNDHPITSTPDFSSPCVKSAKKRKLQESSGAFSSKKKRDILQSLPQNITLANAPCTPLPAAIGELHYTPRVHSHPNFLASKSESRLKSRLSVGRKSGKKLKKIVNLSSTDNRSDISCRSDKEPGTSADWQWKNGPWRRKKCLSSSEAPLCSTDCVSESKSTDSVFCSDSASCTSLFDAGVDLSNSSDSDPEFVKIPKSEYEEIKNRVSAIENRISQEFGSITSESVHNLDDIPLIDESEDEMCRTTKVLNAYEKTLEESEKLGDPVTTDQLAKRLSKELKIRQSLEGKVIRSPSARKIGIVRRRSRENARTSLDKINKNSGSKTLVRQKSLNQDCIRPVGQEQVFYTKGTLRRGRPNTVYSGLPNPSPLRAPLGEGPQQPVGIKKQDASEISDLVLNKSNKTYYNGNTILPHYPEVMERSASGINSNQCSVRRTSSFHGTDPVNSKYENNSCDIRKSVSQGDIVFSAPNSEQQFLINRIDDSRSAERWENGPQFFRKCDNENVPASGRASVARIRSQNAGMVLARMRLFDQKQDPRSTPSRNASLQIEDKIKSEKKSCGTSNSAQSLRIQCMQDNFFETWNSLQISEGRRCSVLLNSPMNFSSGHTSAYKASPKRIGSPRKKNHNQKSPKNVNKKLKSKPLKSPLKDKVIHVEKEFCIKKCNSLRESPRLSPVTSVINNTAPPSVLNCGKENLTSSKSYVLSPLTKISENYSTKSEILQQIHLPENLKETIYDVCTPRVEMLGKMSMSPLKDCNRIDVNQFESNRMNSYKTPIRTPFIKKPLIVKSPTAFTRTPYSRTPVLDSRSHRLATPLKALPNLAAFTPVNENISSSINAGK